MIKTSYQTPELRDANDNIVQQGAFGKNTALSNSTNDGWIDYVMNNLEALHSTIGDSAPTLDGNGHVVEPANLAIGDEDGVRLKTGYVKTSGGTINGILNIAQNLKMQDNQENVFGGLYVPGTTSTLQYLQLYGGETPSSNGGNLQLPNDGSWTLQAKNGTTAYNLVGGTDGTLKWRDNVLAYDSDCVHKTGAETISGQKTLSGWIDATSRNSANKFRTVLTDYQRGIAPSSSIYDSLLIELDQTKENRLGLIEHTFHSDGNNYLEFRSYDCILNSNNIAWLRVGQNVDGTFYTRTNITPPQSSNTNDIATTGWVTSKLTSNYLPLAGGTMTGQTKIQRTPSNNPQSANILSVGGNQNYILSSSSTSVTKGETPPNTTYWGIDFYGVEAAYSANRISLLETSLNTLNDCCISLSAYHCDTNTQTDRCSLEVVANHDGTKAVRPNGDNTVNLGWTNRRWKQLYAGTTTIATSDERLKDNIVAIPDDVLDAWGEIGWCQYQFKDSIEEKGDKARIHTGAIAQRIESIFESHGLDANKYGLLCYDEWEAEPAGRDTPAIKAGNRYSLRYEEALCMEAAYQRRRADRLEQRLSEIEQRLSALENNNGL